MAFAVNQLEPLGNGHCGLQLHNISKSSESNFIIYRNSFYNVMVEKEKKYIPETIPKTMNQKTGIWKQNEVIEVKENWIRKYTYRLLESACLLLTVSAWPW